MKIAVAHNAVDASSAPDERDVLIQAEVVAAALVELGHTPFLLPCDLDLAGIKQAIERMAPDLVFNLVESLGGKGRLISVVPFLLEALAIPFTGAPAPSMHVTSHKVMAKEKMHAAGLPTPAWIGPWPREYCSVFGLNAPPHDSQWIIKSTWEHASLGISPDGLVCAADPEELLAMLRQRAPGLGGSCFAEQFIDGREFNLSIVAGPKGPEVLPPAEILFDGYHENQPRIVCYRAKWDESSFEYSHTPRRFDFPDADKFLTDTLVRIALKCWQVFDLRGYARVDFRVDSRGRPWILEINANPCLSPDAGFAAALDRADISFSRGMARILNDALRTHGTSAESARGSSGKKKPVKTIKPEVSLPDAVFRYDARPGDAKDIREMAAATKFFHSYEIDVAVELVDDRLQKGAASDYAFVFLETAGRLLGYACYGLIPCTASSYDVYWIVVQPDSQRRGIGRMILDEAESLIRKAGGTRIYVDTSQSEKYRVTRAFYQQIGYHCESILADFYAPGDGKVIFSKRL